jgi:hypothetical protein
MISATRSQRIAALLANWHYEIPEGWREHIPESAGSREAVTKSLFLLLLGLNHLEGVSSIEPGRGELEAIAAHLAAALMGGADR